MEALNNLATDAWALFWILLTSMLISLFIIAAATLNDVYRHAIDERVAWRENAQMFGVITAISTGTLFCLWINLK